MIVLLAGAGGALVVLADSTIDTDRVDGAVAADLDGAAAGVFVSKVVVETPEISPALVAADANGTEAAGIVHAIDALAVFATETVSADCVDGAELAELNGLGAFVFVAAVVEAAELRLAFVAALADLTESLRSASGFNGSSGSRGDEGSCESEERSGDGGELHFERFEKLKDNISDYGKVLL